MSFTAVLAREMVELDQKIKAAVLEHRFLDAAAFEDERAIVQVARSQMLRRKPVDDLEWEVV